MYCLNCGKQSNDNEKFCRYCGTPLPVQTANETFQETPAFQETTPVTPMMNNPVQQPISQTKKKKEKSKMSKGKKAKIICISVISVVLVAAISVVILYFTSPAYSVYKDMNDAKYSSAVKEYNRSVEDNFIQELIFNIAFGGYEEKIIEQYKNGEMDYEDAVECLEALKEMNVEGLDGYIEELNRNFASQTAFETANKYYNDGDYENAIKEFSKINEGDANYDTAQSKLNELYPKYISSIVEKAKAYNSERNYKEAVTFVNTAYAVLPDGVNTDELDKVRNESVAAYKSDVMSQVTELINTSQFREALELINEAIAVDDNEDFRNTKATVETKYVETVTTTVDNHLANEDYISAKRVVDTALTVLPGNSSLKALQTKVEKATPTYLLDVCKPYASSNYTEYVNGETFAMGSVNYTNGFTIYNCGSALFNLAGSYTTVNFTVGHVDNSDMNDRVLKIYCDGVLTKEIAVGCEALPQRISLDITGVKQIKFELEDGGCWPTYGFGNVTVK